MRSPLDRSLFAALLLLAALAVTAIGSLVSPSTALLPPYPGWRPGTAAAEPAINWALLDQLHRH